MVRYSNSMTTGGEKRPRGRRLASRIAPGQVVVLITTFGSRDDAERVCARLVRKRCIVCATLLPGAVSIYPWKGKMEKSEEVFVVIKTDARSRREAAKLLLAHHPYETPEIIAIPATAWNDAYYKWLADWTEPTHKLLQ